MRRGGEGGAGVDCDHCLGVDGSNARGSERLSGCVLKRLTPIIAPKRERDGESGGTGGRGAANRVQMEMGCHFWDVGAK